MEERTEMQSKPYRSLIGCLPSITMCTRPDIAYVVTQLSSFLENPDSNIAIRVLRYLKTTREHGILYHGGKNGFKIEAFTDDDCGSNINDRRSVSGIMSKFQRTVALSSAEAEYMALSLCVQEHHFTRENVERGTVKVDYVDTKHQLANLLTKGLGTKTLKYLSHASGIKAKITVQ
ncbi:LOW QUALITY PROTEIN: Polyprotein [Phytophthora palmivora]|uniref:Polyprotein n=1 Tax=Phytophthora palmivora TaxID=4796 RepID=A0A2P4Y170_9STRA|nr:LOW QUALITY PROTEIN: Polyprotein [Phytophthora palmivora]